MHFKLFATKLYAVSILLGNIAILHTLLIPSCAAVFETSPVEGESTYASNKELSVGVLRFLVPFFF